MAGLAAARVVVAAVGDVFTTLHETAKHVGGQTIKFNKSILKSLEPKKKKKKKKLRIHVRWCTRSREFAAGEKRHVVK